MPKFVEEIIKGLLSTKSLRIAFQAFLLSVAVFAFILLIFGYNFDKGSVISPALADVTVRTLLAGSFLVFFLFVWFLMYVQVSKDADDVYSDLREQLVGKWKVNYQASNGPKNDPLYSKTLSVISDIHINPNDKKLELEFKIEDDPIYENSTQIITAVALRHDSANKYGMFYYYKGDRMLRQDMKSIIAEDQNYNHQRGLEIEILGIIAFERTTRKDKIRIMSGSWYDLNGRATQVFSLIDEARKRTDKSTPLVPKSLSTARINASNFAAQMGLIEFNRLS